MALTLVGALLASPLVSAEEEHPDAHHGFHKNLVGIFAGMTGEDRRERALTLGVEYERRINEKFGVGFALETAFGDLDFDVYLAAGAYHSGHWKYFLGAGVEKSDHHDGDESLVRLGVERGFEVGAFEISPQFMVEIVDGDTVIVFGAVFAKGF